MERIGGLINDVIVLAIFAYFSLLVSGKIKLGQGRQEKVDALLQRGGTAVKIGAYGGTVVFGLLVLRHLFDL